MGYKSDLEFCHNKFNEIFFLEKNMYALTQTYFSETF